MTNEKSNAEHLLKEKADLFYKASSDYDAAQPDSESFYKEILKIIYYAMLYRTPEELIHERIDADKPKLGILNSNIEKPGVEDLKVARNFLKESEIQKVDNTIENFLFIAEDQLKAGKTLSIKDWLSRLQGLLQMNGYSVLLTRSNISEQQMQEKVQEEYEKFLLA